MKTTEKIRNNQENRIRIGKRQKINKRRKKLFKEERREEKEKEKNKLSATIRQYAKHISRSVDIGCSVYTQ